MKNLPLMYLVAKPPKLRKGVISVDQKAQVALCLLNFIEDDTAGLVYPKQPDEEGDESQTQEYVPV